MYRVKQPDRYERALHQKSAQQIDCHDYVLEWSDRMILDVTTIYGYLPRHCRGRDVDSSIAIFRSSLGRGHKKRKKKAFAFYFNLWNVCAGTRFNYAWYLQIRSILLAQQHR